MIEGAGGFRFKKEVSAGQAITIAVVVVSALWVIFDLQRDVEDAESSALDAESSALQAKNLATQAIEESRANKAELQSGFQGVKISVGRSINNAVKPIAATQSAIARAQAVQGEALSRIERTTKERLEALEQEVRYWRARETQR